MGTSAARVFSPVLGSWIRTSPVRAVCSTRLSGRTARLIGSPGKSLRVTFWKSLSGGGPAGAPAEAGDAMLPVIASSRAAKSAVFLLIGTKFIEEEPLLETH